MRRCDECNETMIDGYVIDASADLQYFCSKECLPNNYGELHKNGQAYWTNWYDEMEVIK